MSPRSLFQFLCAFLISLSVSHAWAHTGVTRFFIVSVEGLAKQGHIKEVQGVLLLKNLFKDEKFSVWIEFIPENIPKIGTLAKPETERYSIDQSGFTEMPFKLNLSNQKRQRVILNLVVADKENIVVGYQSVPLYFKVERDKYFHSTYEDLFVPKPSGDLEGPHGNATIIESKKVPDGAEVVPLKGKYITPGKIRLKRHQLPKSSGSNRENPDGNEPLNIPILPEPTPLERRGDATDDGPTRYEGSPRLNARTSGKFHVSKLLSGIAPIKPAHAQVLEYTVSGRFSYKGLDDQLHPGWNWFVRLWWQSQGGWRLLGETYINPDGRWSAKFRHPGYAGQNLLIQYRAGGHFFLPQDQNNNPYWWQDPTQTNIPRDFNIGHRSADTSASTGVLPGLGDVSFLSWNFWNKFVLNGLNPARGRPIRLFFPNTWENCGEPGPWSCASTGGDIWLTDFHANPFTVQHELAHQLNFEYWNNRLSPGAGVRHLLTRCYNEGLALSEGFANAVPFWIIAGENSSSPNVAGSSFSIETLNRARFCNGDTNETWVAAALWDLLDRNTDGQDNIRFNNAVEVFGIYLRAGVVNGITDIRPNYRNAASAGHQPLIDNVYRSNTLPVP